MESAWGIKAARLPFRVHVLGKGVEGLLAPPLRVAAATQREEHGLSQQREGKAREEVVVVVTVEDEVVLKEGPPRGEGGTAACRSRSAAWEE